MPQPLAPNPGNWGTPQQQVPQQAIRWEHIAVPVKDPGLKASIQNWLARVSPAPGRATGAVLNDKLFVWAAPDNVTMFKTTIVTLSFAKTDLGTVVADFLSENQSEFAMLLGCDPSTATAYFLKSTVNPG
jgi:hypothetical protein